MGEEDHRRRDSRSGRRGEGRRIPLSLIATAAVMAILIAITGIVVFAGPPLAPGQTSVLQIPGSSTGSASAIQSTTNSTIVTPSSSPRTNSTVSSPNGQNGGSVVQYNETETPPPESATVMLDFSPGAQHALFYEAQNQGYYRQQHLSVGIKPGTGSAATIGAVATGQAEFGFVDASTAIDSISGGAGVRVIGVVTETQPFAVMYLSNSGISSPKDLAGKTYCGSIADASHVMFPAFAAAAGINASSVKFMNVSPPYYSLLASGECQFTSDLLYGLGNYKEAVNQSGTAASVEYFTYSSVGINPYGYVLIANANVIKTNPGLVERFINATYHGLQYVLDNQQAALQYVVTQIPGTSPAAQQIRFNVFVNASKPVLSQSSYKASDPRTLGLINPTLLNQTTTYTVTYLKAKPVPPSQIFTNEFLTCAADQCG